jgi:hypothetical protein
MAKSKEFVNRRFEEFGPRTMWSLSKSLSRASASQGAEINPLLPDSHLPVVNPKAALL